MPNGRGRASAPLIARLRALAGGPGGARLLLTVVAVVALWLGAWRLIATAPLPEKGILVYRVDAGEVVAYPRSDAAMDYLNAMAILSGDGWVNWRDTNRWSVYRPGWGAFLAGLALLTGGEPAAMQGLLSFLLAATAPAFLLLMLQLYPGDRDLLLALAATIPWMLKPFFGWQLQRTMMSEGPAMLLALVFCLLAVRFGRRLEEWTWRQGAVLGLVAGALSLVRGQSRFGILLVVLVLAAASLGTARRRLPFFAGLACGALVVVGPIFLKTSIHLRLPYAGTSYTALYNTLEYTPVGRYVGGTAYPDGAPLSEREAMRLFQGRVRQGIAAALSQPGEMARDGFLHFSRTVHASVAELFGFQLPPPKRKAPVASKLAILYALAGLGLFFAWRRAGPVALAPLAFALGYFSPTVPFKFYSNRLGMPISWVGWVYVAGALLLLLRWGAQRRAVGEKVVAASAGPPPEGWPPRRAFALVAAWLVLATAALIWMDLRPLPEVDAERLLADQRSRRALQASGLEVDATLVAEADRLLNRDGPSERLLAGVAVLPMSLAPGDEPVLQPFSKQLLGPGDRGQDLFYLVSPWKRGGSLGMFQVRLGPGGAADLRPGDVVLVVRQADSAPVTGRNRVTRLDAVAALPTRWAD